MDSLKYPLDGDRDRGPLLIAVCWTTLLLASLIMCVRFHIRHQRRALGADDWTMLMSVALMAVYTTLGTILFLRGGSRHLYFLVLEGEETGKGYLPVTYMMHFTEPFSYLALAAGRISVALLILRILTTNVWLRRCLYILIAISFIINVVWCTLWFAKCPPNSGLAPPYLAGDTWNPRIMFGISAFTAVWNVFMDFALAIVPAIVFWKLQFSVKKKIGICMLMGMGIFVGVSGTVKTVKLNGINGVDFTWDEFDLYLWSVIENILIVICGSMPILKPIFDKLVKSSHRFKETFLTYRRKPSAQSKAFCPSSDEHASQSVDSEGVQQPAPVHQTNGHRTKANGLMEVGLWSTQRSEAATIILKSNARENDPTSSVNSRGWPDLQDTSHLMV